MISVILPIYNVESLLPYCVDSLLNQTYTDFELILVDDGSPDRCPDLIEEYVEKDTRVKAVHKKNGGLSDARNAGIRVAKGEYIAFVDSDDTVAPDYLEALFNGLTETGSDIIECSVNKVTEEEVYRSVYKSEEKSEEPKLTVYNTYQSLIHLINDKTLHQTVWNKMYKRECIDGIEFAVGKTNEDEFWTYQVFSRAKQVAKLDKVLYYYTQRAGSIMGESFSLKRLDALEAKQKRTVFMKERFPEHPELYELSRENLFGSCIYSGMMTAKFLKGEEKKQAKKRIDEVRKEALKEGKLQTKSFWTRAAEISFWGTVNIKTITGRGF